MGSYNLLCSLRLDKCWWQLSLSHYCEKLSYIGLPQLQVPALSQVAQCPCHSWWGCRTKHVCPTGSQDSSWCQNNSKILSVSTCLVRAVLSRTQRQMVEIVHVPPRLMLCWYITESHIHRGLTHYQERRKCARAHSKTRSKLNTFPTTHRSQCLMLGQV